MVCGKYLLLSALVAGLMVLAGGCPALTGLADLLPANVWYVLDNITDFRNTTDLPLESAEPGTVIGDLATLDGCWGTAFTGVDDDAPVALVVVYEFDAAAGTYEGWALPALPSGALTPLIGVVGVEEGAFEVTSDNTLKLTIQRMLTNVHESGQVGSLVEVELGGDISLIERSALVTLDGDAMLFHLDVERLEDVPTDEEPPVFLRFDCLSEQ